MGFEIKLTGDVVINIEGATEEGASFYLTVWDEVGNDLVTTRLSFDTIWKDSQPILGSLTKRHRIEILRKLRRDMSKFSSKVCRTIEKETGKLEKNR